MVVSARQARVFFAAADGVLDQMSDSTEVTVGGETRNPNAHEGLFIAVGKRAALKAGNALPFPLMHFLVGRGADLDRIGATVPATVIEVFLTPAPIPNLNPGMDDLNVTAATVAPHTPLNPPTGRGRRSITSFSGQARTRSGARQRKKGSARSLMSHPGLSTRGTTPVMNRRDSSCSTSIPKVSRPACPAQGPRLENRKPMTILLVSCVHVGQSPMAEGTGTMKITVNIDCTPDEARTFFGLPDVKPMQEKLLREVEARLSANLQAMDPDTLLKTWLSAFKGFEEVQEKFLAQMAGAARAKSGRAP